MPSHESDRDRERAGRWVSAATLGGITAAHATVETARDGLFLTHLSSEQLPWAYLAIALCTLVASTLVGRLRVVLGHRLTLVTLLWITASGVVAAHRFVLSGDPLAYHVLYVWSGVSSSVCVLQFWLGLGEHYTVTEAKKRYAHIALGGSIGALGGFGLAAALSRIAPPDALLPIAASFFVLASTGPAFFASESTRARAPGEVRQAVAPGRGATPSARDLSGLLRQPYARGVTILFALSTIGFVLADYLFKSSVVTFVPADELTSLLGAIYLVLNLSATVLLAGFVTPILRRMGLQRALLVSPVLLAAGAVAILFGGVGIATIALAKGTEGVLRHSLDRTSRELLFLPLPDTERPLAKTFAELVGDKGAKALAAVAILCVVPMGDAATALAVLLAVVASAWLATAVWLRRPYLDVFRETLSARSITTRLDLPDLDLRSLETLIRGLDHPEEGTVGAAISMLSDSGRAQLIPSLILYHPSPRIVAAALEVFARAGRTDFEPHLGRLLTHESASVRAAATRAVAIAAPDRTRLAALARSECACIRVSAMAGMHAHGWFEHKQLRLELEATLSDPLPDARLALARSARLFYTATYRESLIVLLEDAEPQVRRQAILAMRDSGDRHYAEPLALRLTERTERELIREVLAEWGDDAVDVLEATFHRSDLTLRHLLPIPETLAHIGTRGAIGVLLRMLVDDRARSGAIRFRILRSLSRLASAPEHHGAIDGAQLWPILDATIDRALTLTRYQAEIEAARNRSPGLKTPGGDLLMALLHDKVRLAMGRVFLLLGLLHPDEDVDEIERGLSSIRPMSRSSAIELIDDLLSPRRARAVLALVSTASAHERLEAALGSRPPVSISMGATLRRLEGDESESLRAFAAYHAAELAIDSDCRMAQTRARASALERIEALPQEATDRAG